MSYIAKKRYYSWLYTFYFSEWEQQAVRMEAFSSAPSTRYCTTVSLLLLLLIDFFTEWFTFLLMKRNGFQRGSEYLLLYKNKESLKIGQPNLNNIENLLLCLKLSPSWAKCSTSRALQILQKIIFSWSEKYLINRSKSNHMNMKRFLQVLAKLL